MRRSSECRWYEDPRGGKIVCDCAAKRSEKGADGRPSARRASGCGAATCDSSHISSATMRHSSDNERDFVSAHALTDSGLHTPSVLYILALDPAQCEGRVRSGDERSKTENRE